MGVSISRPVITWGGIYGDEYVSRAHKYAYESMLGALAGDQWCRDIASALRGAKNLPEEEEEEAQCKDEFEQTLMMAGFLKMFRLGSNCKWGYHITYMDEAICYGLPRVLQMAKVCLNEEPFKTALKKQKENSGEVSAQQGEEGSSAPTAAAPTTATKKQPLSKEEEREIVLLFSSCFAQRFRETIHPLRNRKPKEQIRDAVEKVLNEREIPLTAEGRQQLWSLLQDTEELNTFLDRAMEIFKEKEEQKELALLFTSCFAHRFRHIIHPLKNTVTFKHDGVISALESAVNELIPEIPETATAEERQQGRQQVRSLLQDTEKLNTLLDRAMEIYKERLRNNNLLPS